MHSLAKIVCTMALVQCKFILLLALGCKNPIDIRTSVGVRTNDLRESRVEYNPFPLNFKITPGISLSIDFKSDMPSGLIFLTGNLIIGDLVAVYLRKGHLSFERRCGKSRVYETYTERLDDQDWHTVKFIHSWKGGVLLVDGINPFRSYHMGPCSDFSSVLFGGLPHDFSIGTRWRGLGLRLRFIGCFRRMRIDDKIATIPPHYFAVSECQQ